MKTRWWWGAAGLLLAGCAASGPREWSASVVSARQEPGLAWRHSLLEASGPERAEREPSPAFGPRLISRSGPARDPEPRLEGWPAARAEERDGALRLHLGAGVAPYDDGPDSYDLLPADRPGFSDSLPRLSWARPLAPRLRFVTTAALVRLQDVAVLDVLQDAEVAWITLGLHLSF